MSNGSEPAVGRSVTSQRFYDAYAHGYWHYLERHEGYLRAVEDQIVDAVGDRREIAMLDVGTGTGERLQRLVSSLVTERVVAIDESPEMVRLAAGNCADARVHAIPLGSPDLPSVATGEFDLVTCLSNVLGHIPASQLVPGLRQVRDLMKPDGVFVFDVNNRYNAVQFGAWRTARNIVRDWLASGGGDFEAAYQNGETMLRTTVHLFNPREVLDMVEQAGFKLSTLEFRDYATGRERGRFGGSMVAKAVRK